MINYAFSISFTEIPLNAANATLNALKSLRTFKEVAAVRGISVKAMLGQK